MRDTRISDQYFNSDENGIFPISKLDLQILDEIQKAIEIVDQHGGLIKAFKKYKSSKTADEDLLEELIVLNSKLFDWDGYKTEGNYGENPEEGERKLNWITFDKIDLPIKHIYNIIRDSHYDMKQKCLVYSVTFNFMDNPANVPTNLVFTFLDEDYRDRKVEELREKLSEGNIQFL